MLTDFADEKRMWDSLKIKFQMLEIDLNIVFHNLLLWFIISFMVFKKNFGGFEFYVNLHIVFSFLSAALKIMQSIFWQKTEPFHILCRLLPKHFHFYQSKIVKWNNLSGQNFFFSLHIFICCNSIFANVGSNCTPLMSR